MRHNGLTRVILLLGALALVAAGAGAQNGDDAETSFNEPGERPDNPELELRLPEPDLPSDSSHDAESSAPQVRVATAPGDAVGIVHGRVVGELAAPGVPEPRDAPFVSVAVPILYDRLDRGITGSAFEPPDSGAQAGDGPLGTTRETGGATTPRRSPAIDSDPPASRPNGPAPGDPVLPAPRDPEQIARELNVDARWPAEARASGGVVANAQVIAYYGHPFSRYMGILGEAEIEETTRRLRERAAEYDAINGDIGVAPAFHIIYGTVYEDASVGILREHKLIEYIEYAAENDVLVFLDHQIGNGTVEDAIRMMLPYLRYEHVHLAFDPEWATDSPGREIGGVTAEDVNRAQELMQEYLEEHDLPGPRMLVVHQFNWRMIENRERVRSDYPLVQLIHHADGFGSPPNKRESWRFNVLATNMPLKGFKLFYPKSWRDGGFDIPLMTPEEVMQLEPVPVYIQYQ
ncbi:MAG: hypothetical protein ACOC2D_05695 [Spirochaetota bacterium]